MIEEALKRRLPFTDAPLVISGSKNQVAIFELDLVWCAHAGGHVWVAKPEGDDLSGDPTFTRVALDSLGSKKERKKVRAVDGGQVSWVTL